MTREEDLFTETNKLKNACIKFSDACESETSDWDKIAINPSIRNQININNFVFHTLANQEIKINELKKLIEEIHPKLS